MSHKLQNAQVTLEYISIVILVCLGVLVMGSYVVRAINAYFKTTDDAVEDSVLEEILPYQNAAGPGCVCGPPLDNGCGVGACNPWEKEIDPQCNPPGCGGGIYCVTDRITCCGQTDVACNANGCLNGYMSVDISCPTEPPIYICDWRPGTCLIQCIGALALPNARWCLLGGVEPAGPSPVTMTVPTNTTYVSPGNCDDTFCQAECLTPFIPQDGAGMPGPPYEVCDCPPTSVYNSLLNICEGICEKDMWIQKTLVDINNGLDCIAVCTAVSGTAAATPQGWECASGNNPISGIPETWYHWPTTESNDCGPPCPNIGWPPHPHCTHCVAAGTNTFESLEEPGPIYQTPYKCYRTGQPASGASEDISIACYCQAADYCCCMPDGISDPARPKCASKTLPETACGNTARITCTGYGCPGGSFHATCASFLNWDKYDTNCGN